MCRVIFSIITLLCLWAPVSLWAEQAWEVSWLTADPGTDVYELEGHSALRMRCSDGSIDVVVNWGVFDFNTPAFVWRFALGETDYLAAPERYTDFIQFYRAENRPVTEQRLNLTPAQAERLWSLLRPLFMTQYRYNYVKDNCSTRPLIYLEMAAPGLIEIPATDSLDGSTFRSEMKRYHRASPWYQFGIDLALGSGIDYPISRREKGFAPVEMKNILAEATVADSLGHRRPLVTSTSTPVATVSPAADTPPPYTTPTAVAWTLAALIAVSVGCDQRRRRVTRWVDSAFFGLEALMGCLLTFLIFVSTHYATSPNWLYLWLNPAVGVLAVGVWFKKFDIILAAGHALNILAVTAVAILLASGVQGSNPAFWPLMGCSVARSANWIVIWIRKRQL